MTQLPCPVCRTSTEQVVVEDRESVPTLQNTTLAIWGAASKGVTFGLLLSEVSEATMIIMNPNYANEIKTLAGSLGWQPEFVTLNDDHLQASR